jgi:hypothetical protein
VVGQKIQPRLQQLHLATQSVDRAPRYTEIGLSVLKDLLRLTILALDSYRGHLRALQLYVNPVFLEIQVEILSLRVNQLLPEKISLRARVMLKNLRELLLNELINVLGLLF